jgi:hypothetical protein
LSPPEIGHAIGSLQGPERWSELKATRGNTLPAKELQNRGIEETHPNKPTTLKGIIMASNTLTTPKVSAGFDINAHFRKLMHELGLTPEDTGGSITFVGKDPACRYQPQRV